MAQPLHLFTQRGVEFVDTHEVRKVLPGHPSGAWESKVFALIHSPFAETLLLDADNMVLADPTYIFSHEDYLEHGAVFWPDFLPPPEGAPWAIKDSAWEILGVDKQYGLELETGQVLVDKRRVYRELMVTLHMNQHSEFYYRYVSHGDTATYRFAWALCGTPLYTVPHRPQMTSDPVRIQFTPSGDPLFQHSRKWRLPVSANSAVPGFLLESECLGWLGDWG